MNRKVRVIVVDDSALMRSLLSKGLVSDPDIEVVAQAADPYQARDLIVQHKPDVLTLDVEMPRMDGVTFLRKLMAKMPIPTIVLSTLTEKGARITLEAMEAGAIDVLTKPESLVGDLPKMMGDICRAVKAASRAKVGIRLPPKHAAPVSALVENSTDKIVVIGASTGGVEALARILPRFPRTAPGIVVTIHMPGNYTKAFAERLDRLCAMQCKEAAPKDRVRNGQILIAPGGSQHLHVNRFGGQYRVSFEPSKPSDAHVPAVNALFTSAAKAAGANAVGLILTGMGDDGAAGMAELRSAGARCFAQDERTSVVFGMPKAALENGSAERAVPLDDLPQFALDAMSSRRCA